jgi:uncharacterized protein (DUF1778 family)
MVRSANSGKKAGTPQLVEETVSNESRVPPGYEVMKLSARHAERLIEALLNPPPPNERLREAARCYRALVRQKEGL